MFLHPSTPALPALLLTEGVFSEAGAAEVLLTVLAPVASAGVLLVMILYQMRKALWRRERLGDADFITRLSATKSSEELARSTGEGVSGTTWGTVAALAGVGLYGVWLWTMGSDLSGIFEWGVTIGAYALVGGVLFISLLLSGGLTPSERRRNLREGAWVFRVLREDPEITKGRLKERGEAEGLRESNIGFALSRLARLGLIENEDSLTVRVYSAV